MTTKATNKSFNEMVKQGNSTKRWVMILSRLLKFDILNSELRNLVILIIELLNKLNFHKIDSEVKGLVNILSTTQNIEVLTNTLNSLKSLLEDRLSPQNDFNNTCKRKSLTKEKHRKQILISFVIDMFERFSKFNLGNQHVLFDLLSKIETITNSEYIYNHFISSKSDYEKLRFLLQQVPYIGRTTKSNSPAPYTGSRKGVDREIQKKTKSVMNHMDINNIQILFNGMGGEFSSLVPLLDDSGIKKIGCNDINPSTQNLHITIKNNPGELKNSIVDVFSYVVSEYGSIDLEKEDFKLVFKDLHTQLNKLEENKVFNEKTAALLMILLNWSFSGKYELKDGVSSISTGSDMNKYTNHRLFQKVDMFNYYYNKYNVTFTIGDYKEVIKNEDSETTLFFNDSPFMVESSSKLSTDKENKSTKITYGFKDFKHIENLESLESLKGQFIYFNYQNPHITDCVKRNGFKMMKINKTIKNNYIKKGGKRMKKIEVIVTSNYKVNQEKVSESSVNNTTFFDRKVA